MFSSRTPSDLAPNRLAQALERRRAAGGAVIDLTESNPTRALVEYPPDLLVPLADSRGLRYEPNPFGLMDARRAVAADYARRGIAVPPGRVVLTTSTSEANSLLFKLLGDPGDEVLVPRPSYPLFDHLASLDGVAVRAYDLEYHGAWSIDVASVERALTSRSRAMVIVNPNNPTGSFVSAGELDQLAAICARRDIALIADEVFADYELEPGSARGAGHPLEREDVLAFTLGGLSKSVGLPQLKLGWFVVSGPDRLVDAALERLELICDTYLSVSIPIQAAAADLFAAGVAVRLQIQKRVAGNYRQLRSLAEGSPACRVLRSQGGWYGVLQAPAVKPEEDLVLELLEEEGVLVHPGYFFDFPRECYLVVSLLLPPERFADAVGRVLRRATAPAVTPHARE